jgi:sulfonate transport system substrate-binding protein
MNRPNQVRRRLLGATACAAALTPLALPRSSRAQAAAPIRVGYIPTTTVQAQIAHTLDKTDILARNGLSGRMTLFNSSPAVNEALVSGAIDVGFVSDFAAITVMAAGAPVVAIGHQSVFRGAVMATTASGIKRIEDLRGKPVYGLFGVTVYKTAQEMVRKAGLQPGRDMNFVNMNFTEMADAVRARKIDAFFTWDPWITFFEKQGLATTLSADPSPAMLVMAREAFVKDQGDATARFLRAHAEALFWASRNKVLTNAWFRLPEAARQIDLDVIEASSAHDPNWVAKSFADIPIGFTAAQVSDLQTLAQFALDNKLTTRLAPVAERVNVAVGQRADVRPRPPFDPAAVKVTFTS